MYIATPSDCNFLFSTVVARSQTKWAISKAKRAIGLKLAGVCVLSACELVGCGTDSTSVNVSDQNGM